MPARGKEWPLVSVACHHGSQNPGEAVELPLNPQEGSFGGRSLATTLPSSPLLRSDVSQHPYSRGLAGQLLPAAPEEAPRAEWQPGQEKAGTAG